MPVQIDTSFCIQEDVSITVVMTPPVSIINWNVQFSMSHRFGSTNPLITKSMSSGYVNVSGIAPVKTDVGIFNVTIRSQDTSGLPPGNYAYQTQRLDSGSRTVLSLGYISLGNN